MEGIESSSNIPGYNITLKWVKNIFSRSLRVSNNVPKHVGFIMDGNRRYARKNGIEVKEGHETGFFTMSKILELCYESGVTCATVYAFSIENFKRSPYEVDALMNLARLRIKQIVDKGEMAEKYGIKVKIIGDTSLLDADLIKDIQNAMEITKNNNRAILNICFPYTGREEIYHSMKECMAKYCDNGEPEFKINESSLDLNLYTGGEPPLDLLIRTSGVARLSDFMLWQISNKGVVIELIDCLWPDFGPLRMAWILLKFAFQKSFSNRTKKFEEEDIDLDEDYANGSKKDI
ncbi:ditrans,polycis-polyprenyl diphosphate synthase NDAI_0G01550 [Naumovozyma dairenensis CBS 421]|uniref:Alkyl transferase n=1 Tax=Naumovozyma dairenensis (strain ATCC 10597 / BCRC 20456 / CBS 421 / NBRC 0211 / NRRL Y-12639) TaxID=1071378 RepID=G0WDS0_NAUDC|nr:hypothetical protein NDAI_0G01550 [Naumovozyma dairenensis CBS 421]CCD25931.2 hypothetical protein NDAI_0G01550 [Naumovozyma dairenensis CBS 421]